jgi:monofunctional biosynthetic peptidoglycan transglycosylase
MRFHSQNRSCSTADPISLILSRGSHGYGGRTALTDDVDDSALGGPEDEHRRPGPDGTDGPPPLVEDGREPDAGLPESPRAGWSRRLQLAGLVLTAGFVLWLLFTWLTWPDVAALADRDPTTTAFIERYREARRQAGEPDAVAWQPVPWDRISPNLKRAVIASEDTEFFFHEGFSRHEMKEALKKAIREGEAPRGASTITQQVAKNLWLTPRRSLTRKLREAILTRQLEEHLTKRRILELYLNIVEFGPGIYGAEAAARHYFGISAAGLSPRQGAMLAAGLPRPKTWNPSSDSEYYRARVERILQIAERLGFLDQYVGRRAPGAVQVQPPEATPAP